MNLTQLDGLIADTENEINVLAKMLGALKAARNVAAPRTRMRRVTRPSASYEVRSGPKRTASQLAATILTFARPDGTIRTRDVRAASTTKGAASEALTRALRAKVIRRIGSRGTFAVIK